MNEKTDFASEQSKAGVRIEHIEMSGTSKVDVADDTSDEVPEVRSIRALRCAARSRSVSIFDSRFSRSPD